MVRILEQRPGFEANERNCSSSIVFKIFNFGLTKVGPIGLVINLGIQSDQVCVRLYSSFSLVSSLGLSGAGPAFPFHSLQPHALAIDRESIEAQKYTHSKRDFICRTLCCQIW
jgi:hypothetical protein